MSSTPTWGQAGGAPRRAEWSRTSFPGDPGSIAGARSFVRGLLDQRCPDPVVEDLVLATSEVVTNAVVHVGGPLDLLVAVHEAGDGTTVRLEVGDRSPQAPAPRRAGDGDAGGRGLAIVDTVADAWGWDPTEDGKRVWLQLRVPDRPSRERSRTSGR